MDLQLKRIRKMRGVKQGEIARELGVKTSRYGTWERGERNMSFPQACAIADILDCTLDEIAGREPVREYTDPRQEQLNGCYESLNEESKTQVSEMVKSIAADPARRIEKEGEGREDLPGMEEIA